MRSRRRVRERLADEELLREQAEQLAVAGDLHNMVIQRLFAAGLALDATIRLVHEPGLAERLGLVADELDAAIRELRGAIFGLRSARGDHDPPRAAWGVATHGSSHTTTP